MSARDCVDDLTQAIWGELRQEPADSAAASALSFPELCELVETGEAFIVWPRIAFLAGLLLGHAEEADATVRELLDEYRIDDPADAAAWEG